MSDEILATEFSPDFVEQMQNRMIVSFHKYGPIRKAYPHAVNALANVKKRMERYQADGNLEWLVDAANFLMIEYLLPAHPEAHFKGTDADASPGRVTVAGHESDMGNAELDALARHREAQLGNSRSGEDR